MNQSPSEPRYAPLMSALDSLLTATNAFKNVRALALMGLTLITAILVAVACGFLAKMAGSMLIASLGALLAFLVVFYGASAVGILLMQEAQGNFSQSIADVVLLSLFSSHRLIAVAILEFLIVLAAVIAIAIVLFICKIPFVGPFLFTFVFPVAAVLLGVLVFSLFYVIFPLAGPAVWSGSTTFQVVARLNTVARGRLISVILQQFILFLIVSLAGMIIFAIVGLGFMLATGLSASVIGASGSMGLEHFAALIYGGAGAGVAGHALAGGIGGGILFVIAALIPALIATKGLCIIYLNATHGLDFAQAEAQLETGMTAMKQKAAEAKERARQLAEQQANNLRAAASAPPAAASATATAADAMPSGDAASAPETVISTCPNCQAQVTAEDAFCGECGHKLK